MVPIPAMTEVVRNCGAAADLVLCDDDAGVRQGLPGHVTSGERIALPLDLLLHSRQVHPRKRHKHHLKKQSTGLRDPQNNTESYRQTVDTDARGKSYPADQT